MLNHKLRAGVVGAVATCGLAGACLAPAASQAQPVSGSGGAPGCASFDPFTGVSTTVPDGTLTIAISGTIYKCQNGTWVKQPGLVRTSPIGIAPPVVTAPVFAH